MLHYFLTGEEASRQTVVDLAECVLNLDDGTKTIFRWLDRGDTGLYAVGRSLWTRAQSRELAERARRRPPT
jgi:hypothetical protein